MNARLLVEFLETVPCEDMLLREARDGRFDIYGTELEMDSVLIFCMMLEIVSYDLKPGGYPYPSFGKGPNYDKGLKNARLLVQ